MKGTLLKDFGGKDRHLWFNAKAWAKFGDHFGLKLRLAHFQDDLMETELPVSALHVLIWCGLLHDEPDLTEDEVAEWLHEENVVGVLMAFMSRFAGTSPETVGAVAGALGVELTDDQIAPLAEPLKETGT